MSLMSKPSRRLESQTTFPGSDLRTDWEAYVPADGAVDTTGWSERDFSTFVRETNAAFKKAGDGTRVRSVTFDRSYE